METNIIDGRACMFSRKGYVSCNKTPRIIVMISWLKDILAHGRHILRIIRTMVKSTLQNNPPQDAIMTTTRRGWILRISTPPLLVIAPTACGLLGGGGDETRSLPPQEPLRLEISIASAADANIDTHDRGAPILLRIYELASDVGYLEADFFSLQDREKITLGSDLLSVDTWLLRPGETRSIRRKARPGTTAIGVFAAYRDLPASVWRISHPLPPAVDAHWYRQSPRLRLAVTVQARGLVVKDADAVADPGLATRARESAAAAALPPMPPSPPAPAVPAVPPVPGFKP